MADSMDLVQHRVQENLDRALANTIKRPTAPSAFFCEDCDAPIPEARRRAVLSVTRCVDCQELEENTNAFN